MPSIRLSARAVLTAPTRLALITAVAPPDCPISKLPCVVNDNEIPQNQVVATSLTSLSEHYNKANRKRRDAKACKRKQTALQRILKLSASDQRDKLQSISLVEPGLCECFARYNFTVHLRYDSRGADL